MVVASLPQPEDPGSLRQIYERVGAIDGMEVIKNGSEIFNNIGLKSIKGEVAVGPNAAPRANILEIIASIPSDMVVYNREIGNHEISRCYFRADSDRGDEGEALVVIVGHGTADTVVGYVPKIKRSRLMAALR